MLKEPWNGKQERLHERGDIWVGPLKMSRVLGGEIRKRIGQLVLSIY